MPIYNLIIFLQEIRLNYKCYLSRVFIENFFNKNLLLSIDIYRENKMS